MLFETAILGQASGRRQPGRDLARAQARSRRRPTREAGAARCRRLRGRQACPVLAARAGEAAPAPRLQAEPAGWRRRSGRRRTGRRKKAEAADAQDGRTAGKDDAPRTSAARRRSVRQTFFDAERLRLALQCGPPALPPGRQDAGMGREQLLPPADRAAERRPRRRSTRSGATSPGTTGTARSCSQHLAEAEPQLHRDDVRPRACSTCRSRPGKHETKFDGGKMTLDAGRRRWSSSTRRSAATDAPDGSVADPRQPELLPPRRPLPRGERRAGRQVRRPTSSSSTPSTAARSSSPTRPRRGRSSTCCCRFPVGRHAGRRTARHTQTVPLDLRAVPHADGRVPLLLPRGRASSRTSRCTSRRTSSSSPSADGRSPSSVVDKPTQASTRESWDYVSQHGTDDEVLALLEPQNVHALNLDRIAFRMKDQAFFEAVTALLKPRHVYNPTLWSYGVLHNAVAAVARVPAARRPARRRVRRADRQPAADHRSGRPAPVRAPGVQAAGQRPRARARATAGRSSTTACTSSTTGS